MDNSQNKSQLCNSQIQKETNTRIYDRNIPSQMLQPYLDVRPVMTKYSYFPIVDPRKPITVPMEQLPIYNINTTFNPGNATAPWSGFASSINTESELRNQVYALQKCSQAVFVPSSNSDLYNYKFHSQKQASPHDLLFQQDKFSDFNPNPDKGKVGSGMFYNNTRVQVRDMTKQKC
jgi:hypothetical protein